MSSRLYIDTSVYLSILLGESDSKQLLKDLNKSVLCSSSLLLLEAERNLIRLAREKVLSVTDYENVLQQVERDVESFILRDLTPDLCVRAPFPAIRTPRSSDLAHLRTARWFLDTGGLDRFMTLDKQQREAAREIGLPV